MGVFGIALVGVIFWNIKKVRDVEKHHLTWSSRLMWRSLAKVQTPALRWMTSMPLRKWTWHSHSTIFCLLFLFDFVNSLGKMQRKSVQGRAVQREATRKTSEATCSGFSLHKPRIHGFSFVSPSLQRSLLHASILPASVTLYKYFLAPFGYLFGIGRSSWGRAKTRRRSWLDSGYSRWEVYCLTWSAQKRRPMKCSLVYLHATAPSR